MTEFVHLKQLLAKALESVQFERDMTRQAAKTQNDLEAAEAYASIAEHETLITEIRQALKP